MKKIFSQLTSFLSYHNAVPIAVSVLFVGGASAFAASTAGVLPLPALVQSETSPKETVQEVDVSALISANLDAFDFSPTVTSVVETDSEYTVSYSLQTLAPKDGAWAPFTKTGEFSIAKSALPDTGLQGYVVQKLQDIENGERHYLARAQTAEKALADAREARPANAFAALVGLALDQIPVPIIEKPVPEPLVPESQPGIQERSAVPTPTPEESVRQEQEAQLIVDDSAATTTSPTPDNTEQTATSTATTTEAAPEDSSTPETPAQ